MKLFNFKFKSTFRTNIKMSISVSILSIALILFLSGNLFAQEKARVFPEGKLQNFLGLDDTSSPPVVLDGRAADIQNITLDITGAGKKRNG